MTSNHVSILLCMTCRWLGYRIGIRFKKGGLFPRQRTLKHPTSQTSLRFDDIPQAQSRGLLSLGLLTWSTQLASQSQQMISRVTGCKFQHESNKMSEETVVRLPHRHAEKKNRPHRFLQRTGCMFFLPILYLSLSTSIDQSQSRDGPISDESAQESVFHIKIH